MPLTLLRKRRRNPTKYDTLEIFAAWAQERGVRITAPDALPQFAKFVGESLKASLESPITLFGGRTQAMFEAVVANLGRVLLVKREDAGDLFSRDEGLRIPDTRIILADGRQLLVETKNWHGRFDKPYKLDAEYLDGLLRYAGLNGCPLRIAIFWSRMQSWTLVDPTLFAEKGRRRQIDFTIAMKKNDMGGLGDVLLGCPFPVIVRAYVQKMRGGKQRMRWDKYSYVVAGREVGHPGQRQLLLFLMLWGEWQIERTEIVEEDDSKRIVDAIFMPTEDARGGRENSGSGCVLNAFLSTVLSRYWLHSTSTITGEFATMLPSREAWTDTLLDVTLEGELPLAIVTVQSSLDGVRL